MTDAREIIRRLDFQQHSGKEAGGGTREW